MDVAPGLHPLMGQGKLQTRANRHFHHGVLTPDGKIEGLDVTNQPGPIGREEIMKHIEEMGTDSRGMPYGVPIWVEIGDHFQDVDGRGREHAHDNHGNAVSIRVFPEDTEPSRLP